MKIRVADVLPKIPGPPNEVWPEGVRSAVGFEHGSMQLRLFAPGAMDRQQPHTRDELYVIAAGHATSWSSAAAGWNASRAKRMMCSSSPPAIATASNSSRPTSGPGSSSMVLRAEKRVETPAA